MGKEISLGFVYTEDEYVSAARAYFSRTLKTRRDLILAVVVLVAALAAWLMLGYSIAWLLCVAAALLLLAFVGYVTLILPRLCYHRQPKLRDEYTLEFSDVGIAFRTRHVESNIQWDLCKQVIEQQRFYLLIL